MMISGRSRIEVESRRKRAIDRVVTTISIQLSFHHGCHQWWRWHCQHQFVRHRTHWYSGRSCRSPFRTATKYSAPQPPARRRTTNRTQLLHPSTSTETKHNIDMATMVTIAYQVYLVVLQQCPRW